MKKFFIAVFVAGILIYGCTKESSVHVPEGITGTWKYAGYSGGFAGFPFMKNDTIETYLQLDTAQARILAHYDGKDVCTSYTFEGDSTGYNGLLTTSDSLFSTNQFDVHLLHDTLTLYPHGFVDAFTAYFLPVSKHFTWCDGSNH